MLSLPSRARELVSPNDSVVKIKEFKSFIRSNGFVYNSCVDYGGIDDYMSVMRPISIQMENSVTGAKSTSTFDALICNFNQFYISNDKCSIEFLSSKIIDLGKNRFYMVFHDDKCCGTTFSFEEYKRIYTSLTCTYGNACVYGVVCSVSVDFVESAGAMFGRETV